MNQKAKLVWPLVLLALVSLSFLGMRTTYYVERSAASNMLCNGAECYIFIEQTRFGWATSGFQDAWGFLQGLVGGAYRPTHKRPETLVARLTSHDVERFTFDETVFPLEVYQGVIYVSVFGGTEKCLCRWTGRGFEKLSEEETKVLHAAERSGATADFARQGWTKSVLLSGAPVTVKFGGTEKTVTLRGDLLVGESIAVRAGTPGTEQVVWSLEKPHRVSRDEYYRIFGPDPERYRVPK